MPTLQIVSDTLWEQAQRRRALTRQSHGGYRRANGQLAGRDEAPTPHLLTGLLKCACGSSLIATSRANKDKSVRRYYACSRHYRQQGSEGCRHLVPYDTITEAILSHFERLTPGVIEQMIADEYDQWLSEVQALQGQQGTLAQERDRLDGELSRLAEAIATGGQLAALLAALSAKQALRNEVAAKLEHTRESHEAALSTLRDWHTRLAALCTASAGGLGAALRAEGRGRRMLRQLLPTPIVVTPMYTADGLWQGWAYEGNAYLGRLAGSLTCHPRTECIRIS
jgi:hypothetical protein